MMNSNVLDAQRIFTNIKNDLGKSGYHDTYPKLVIDDSIGWLCGEYRDDWNEIILYSDAFVNEEQLARTILHEYIHYLQDPVKFDELKLTHDYWNNPFEIEAFAKENRWQKYV